MMWSSELQLHSIHTVTGKTIIFAITSILFRKCIFHMLRASFVWHVVRMATAFLPLLLLRSGLQFHSSWLWAVLVTCWANRMCWKWSGLLVLIAWNCQSFITEISILGNLLVLSLLRSISPGFPRPGHKIPGDKETPVISSCSQCRLQTLITLLVMRIFYSLSSPSVA